MAKPEYPPPERPCPVLPDGGYWAAEVIQASRYRDVAALDKMVYRVIVALDKPTATQPGGAFAKETYLAEKLGVHVDQVGRSRRNLEGLGLLARAGSGRCQRWYPLLPATVEAAPPKPRTSHAVHAWLLVQRDQLDRALERRHMVGLRGERSASHPTNGQQSSDYLSDDTTPIPDRTSADIPTDSRSALSVTDDWPEDSDGDESRSRVPSESLKAVGHESDSRELLQKNGAIAPGESESPAPRAAVSRGVQRDGFEPLTRYLDPALRRTSRDAATIANCAAFASQDGEVMTDESGQNRWYPAAEAAAIGAERAAQLAREMTEESF